jgi:hypothetical protein
VGEGCSAYIKVFKEEKKKVPIHPVPKMLLMVSGKMML